MKYLKIILIILITVVLFFPLKKFLRRTYYNYKYDEFSKNSIEWDKTVKLKWSDFNFQKNDDGSNYFFAKVGLVNRYEFNDSLGIDIKSKTLFFPLESYVSDTSDYFNLLLLQSRFNLCEIYRRKLNKKIMSFDFNKFPDSRKDSVDLNSKLYYNLFENKWDSIMNLSNENLLNEINKINIRVNSN